MIGFNLHELLRGTAEESRSCLRFFGRRPGRRRQEDPASRAALPSTVGGRLAVPSFRIHPAERRVGQALPLRLDAFERRLRLRDPEVATRLTWIDFRGGHAYPHSRQG